jgi:NAD(P)H-hydrate epimerase
MGGAVDMAAEAALRSGAGLVSVATRKEHIAAINARCPEVMCHEIDAAEKLDSLLVRATVVIAGPGLGKSDWSRELLAKVLSSETPKLLDADALNLLTEKIDNAVLTPHPKEAARMLGITVEKVQDDRFTAVRSLQEKYGGVFVLKGAGTLVFDVSEKNMEWQVLEWGMF